MKTRSHSTSGGGFTLMETVIAIGVLAVLLSAFLAVFTPAAQGIQNALSTQDADRMAYALESELTTLRDNESDTYTTGFSKAFAWISESKNADEALIIYQYRGDMNQSPRADGSLEPFEGRGVAGEDFLVQPMVRRASSTFLEDDFKALEGRPFAVVLTQLVYNNEGEMVRSEENDIVNPRGGGAAASADEYPEAVIAFGADFFRIRASSVSYLQSSEFDQFFSRISDNPPTQKPVFTRNLAVRR